MTSPLLSSEGAFETFPTFSPDGNTLYFCSAKVRTMPKEYDQVRYDLCSVSFDPATRRFGTVVDTLYKASEIDKSVSFPGFPRMESICSIPCPVMGISLFGIRMLICT